MPVRDAARRIRGAPAAPDLAEGDERLACQIVDDFLPDPAYFIDRYGDVMAANRTAARLLHLDGRRPNYLEMLFLDPRARDRFPCWERDAAEAVARFRAQSGEFLGDSRLSALISYLCECSSSFANLWAQHHISDGSSYEQVLRHPELGQLSLARVGFDLAVRPGLQLILLSPRTDGIADQLASWDRRSRHVRGVAGVPA